MVQLRDKHACARDLVCLGQRLLAVLRPLGVPLIVNDRVDVARAIDADGAHVGQSDVPVRAARDILGESKILGLTIESEAELDAVDPTQVDYLGASVFATGTKRDVAGVFGVEGIRKLVGRVSIPVVAIGGIGSSNAAQVTDTGVAGIAVVSAILGASDARQAAEDLLRACARRS
jgi:thiamine-phosphate pyrophosphorylase